MSTDIAAENAVATDLFTWQEMQTSGYGDISVAGFARSISYAPGDTVEFSVDGPCTDVWIFRVGWYGGSGFRRVAQVANTPATQPEAAVIPGSNGATTCTAWSVTSTWAIPETATSGLYTVMFRNADDTNAFYATFVVRDDDSIADLIYKTSDATWGAAYNHYGTKSDVDGRNVYGDGQGVGSITDRSYAVSYHRPVLTMGGVIQTYWWACELPLIRFLERCGYSMKYTTSVDLDRVPTALGGADVFISSGHDEYWSGPMRDRVEEWRDTEQRGLLFMSGNEVFWKTRYEYTETGDAIMWCYKDTMPGPSSGPDAAPGHSAGAPLDPVEWTGTWKDTRWAERRPEWFLTGTDFRMNGVNDFDASIPMNPYGPLKVWGNSSLRDGDLALTRVIGFEADEMRPTQPAESVRYLASYTRTLSGIRADDNGQTYGNSGELAWGVVAQRYSSGSATVGFGTCQWSWMLDGTHARGTGTEVSTAAQQFTTNLLQGLGATATTLPAGLVWPSGEDALARSEFGFMPGTSEEPPPVTPPFQFRRPNGDSLTLTTAAGVPLSPAAVT